MTEVKFVLDNTGVEQILKSAGVRKMVTAATETLAANVTAQVPAHVAVDAVYYEDNDRFTGLVTIKDPSGKRRQLKHGTLTRAAGMMGLEVRS